VITKQNRRRFLCNAGVCLALPAMSSLLPRRALSQPPGTRRLVVIHHPNGTTQGQGQVEPPEDLVGRFAHLRDRMTVVKDLNNATLKNLQARTGYYTAHAGGFIVMYSGDTIDGAGDERTSFDQQIAESEVTAGTSLETLAINCFQKRNAQTGVAPQTFNNLSWKGAGRPVTPFQDPRTLFERLFAGETGPSPELQARVERRQLYLDAVHGEIQTLRRRLGTDDQQRLDEYLTGVEELDLRTRDLVEGIAGPACGVDTPTRLEEVDLSRIQGDNYALVLDLMQDLSLRALQCDRTRVLTFMHAGIANGSEILQAVDRSAFEGSCFGWHPLSHWNSPYGSLSTNTGVNRRDCGRLLGWHYDRVAGFVDRLAATPGPAGVPLLDDTLVVFGSTFGYGIHHASQIYQLLIGGGPEFRKGIDVNAGGAPTSHLWASIKRGFGVPGPVGRSSGEVSGVLS
jgi:hypothetical protein